jgi:hypothetical protein
MSLYKDASLVMIPTAYKDGKLYSIRPTNGSGDFTFSRGSNLAATRVDVNGLIEKGRENLLLQSNQFDTTWATSNASVTGGQSGYDGSSDAWLLQNNAGYTTAVVKQNFSLGSAVRSSSVYAKAGNVNFLRILMYDGATSYVAWFNLTDGSTSNESNIIDAKSTSVGSGWYRCEISANTNITNLNIYPSIVAGSSFTDNGDNIYIQDAQLEQGLVATDYIETGASTAQAGILEDMPRLDYSASCPSLLLEPQRLNKMYQSEYLRVGSGASGAFDWSNTYVTLTSNNATSPDGYQNATKMETTSANGSADSYVSYTASSTNTMSLFVKAGTSSSFSLFHIATGGTGEVTFNLTNGTFTRRDELDSSATITDYGNDWWRITMTYTAGTGGYISRLRVNGVGYVHIFGWQIEEGSYPTSYIPTYGTSQTRSADSCAATSVSDIINQNEGTLFVDFVWNGKQDNIDYFLMAIIDSYGQNEIRLGGYNLALYGRVYSGGTLTFAQNYTTGAAKGQRYKVIIKYGSEGVKTFANGQLKDSGTPTLPTGTMYEIRITRSGVGTHSSINQSVYFPTALTDSECIALTTI